MSFFLRVPAIFPEVYTHRTEMAANLESINSDDLFVSTVSESDEENESLMDFQLSCSDEDIPDLVDGQDLIDVEMIDAELVTV